MKKLLLNVVVCLILILGITGCFRREKVSIDELNLINDKIVNYFQTNGSDKYNNYSYNYVDEEKRVVVVGLVDNSKKQQEWFRKNVVNSKYIKFEQGNHLSNETDLDIEKKINIIVDSGPATSSNPYDYIRSNQAVYDELVNSPRDTFQYSIRDLIESNAGNGLKSYIEALLCMEINNNFEYDFESANDFLIQYKEFLSNDKNKLNSYDEYAKTLLK